MLNCDNVGQDGGRSGAGPRAADGARRAAERVRGGAAAGAPRRARAGNGLLLLQLGGGGGAPAAHTPHAAEDPHRRLG